MKNEIDQAPHALPPHLVNLASELLGAAALRCSDDRFAGMEHLVKDAPPTFAPEEFGPEGKTYSGWESGRNFKRTANHTNDWCILRLAVPGIVHLIDIDTSFFLGNYPALASVEGCYVESDDAEILENACWDTLVERSALRGGSHNFCAVKSPKTYSHIRLNIFPDGGVARLRVLGEVDCSKLSFISDEMVNLVSAQYGGQAVAASNMFYSSPQNLLLPNIPENIGEGWETARRRDNGNDWAVFVLGVPGEVHTVEVSTLHFKHNSPSACSVEAIYAPNAPVDLLTVHEFAWKEIVPWSTLLPDQENSFDCDTAGPVTHLRLQIYPDGGVSRFRALGAAQNDS